MRMTILIAVFGAAGALSRWKVGEFCTRFEPSGFPVGTYAVNILGSFLLGVLMSISAHHTIPEAWRVPLATGLLGSFTTFSTFSVETVNLIQDGQGRMALLNIGAQLGTGLLAAAGGLVIGSLLGKALS